MDNYNLSEVIIIPNYLSKLKRSFYERDTLDVAQELLGKYLINKSDEGITIGKIVESEGYRGTNDRAAHSYRGRKTKRTRIMFGHGGYAYVFTIHGRYAFNIVTQKTNMPEAVLIRAVEPIDGLDLMSRRRRIEIKNKSEIINLTNGPSKLCMAMGIDMSLYGSDLCGDVIFLTEPAKKEVIDIISTPRINVNYAEEAKCYPWRFYINSNEFVSKAKYSSNCGV